MSLVDWLITEQLVAVFREAGHTRPGLNAELEAHSPFGEPDVLAGAGVAARVDATDGGVLVVTPKRIARVVGDRAHDLVTLSELTGYDWISPEMSEKVALKDAHQDRLYLYPRAAPPVVLDHLGEAVYPLMTFLGRVLELQSQKVLRRKLDEDLLAMLGRCLVAATEGPFFGDSELFRVSGRDRDSLRVVAAMWPRMNLAAPDVLGLLERIVPALSERAVERPEDWSEWIGVEPIRLDAALEVFRRVSQGRV